MLIGIVSFLKLLEIGMHSLHLLYPLLNVLRIASLDSHHWWDLENSPLIRWPWRMYVSWCVTSKLFWIWFWFNFEIRELWDTQKSSCLVWKHNLFQRHQEVSVNRTCSSQRLITAGVPQGSVFGPMLFLICINDISDFLTGMTRLFVDDTSLSFSFSDPAEIETVINNDLRKRSTWTK